jgi:NAD(P)H-flavin reductase
MNQHELIPYPVTIKEIITESRDIKTLILSQNNDHTIRAAPGQFVEVSLPGYGEATFAITRMVNDKELALSIKRLGHLTKMLHRTSVGDTIGIRGPYGNHFPVDDWHNKTIHIIGGGIGIAPLRPVIDHILSSRQEYRSLHILFGARTPQDIIYKDDLKKWQKDSSISLITTIDIPQEQWNGRVGLIPQVINDIQYSPRNAIAVVCGPPVMIKFTIAALYELGWESDAMYTTLEMKMQCGIGQCGRCNIGDKFICTDGPVFRLDQIPEFFTL